MPSCHFGLVPFSRNEPVTGKCLDFYFVLKAIYMHMDTFDTYVRYLRFVVLPKPQIQAYFVVAGISAVSYTHLTLPTTPYV